MTPVLLLLAPLLQEPAAALDQPHPALARWRELQKGFRDAAALRIRSTIVLSDPAAEEADARTLKLQVEAEMMRPSAGSIRIEGAEYGPGDAVEAVHVRYLGDGRRILQVEDESRSAFAECAAWAECSAMFFLSYLGPEWSGDLIGTDEVAFLPAREDRPGWTGIGLTGPDLFGEQATSEAWLDPQGELRSFVLPIGGTAKLVAEIAALERLAEADPKAFVRALPEGYEIAEEVDFEAGMLEVGAEAPAVTLIGLDDVEFTLASLRGKTVLLNFWFFH
jgi:hypothetical protein